MGKFGDFNHRDTETQRFQNGTRQNVGQHEQKEHPMGLFVYIIELLIVSNEILPYRMVRPLSRGLRDRRGAGSHPTGTSRYTALLDLTRPPGLDTPFGLLDHRPSRRRMTHGKVMKKDRTKGLYNRNH
jgi:hypothetical protein